jgi:NAD(P)-dependent dehydrogenase (short-subunit alcohol dehydrogenase family)
MDSKASSFATTRSVVPHLAPASGTIVTTAGVLDPLPRNSQTPYASLRAGVAVFTKGIAKTYGKHGMRANCVCAGAVETAPLAALRLQPAEQRGYPVETALERFMVEEWGFDAAFGRAGQPEEVGELSAFLLSPRASYLTGSLINIDGGTNFKFEGQDNRILSYPGQGFLRPRNRWKRAGRACQAPSVRSIVPASGPPPIPTAATDTSFLI